MDRCDQFSVSSTIDDITLTRPHISGYYAPMPELEFDPFYLDREYLNALADQLEKTGSQADSGMAQFLRDYTHQGARRLPLASLGMAASSAGLVRSTGMDSIEHRGVGARRIGPSDWGLMFIEEAAEGTSRHTLRYRQETETRQPQSAGDDCCDCRIHHPEVSNLVSHRHRTRGLGLTRFGPCGKEVFLRDDR